MISRMRWSIVALLGAALTLPGVAWAAETAAKCAGCCFPGCCG